MNNILEKFKHMRTVQKVEFLLASLFTLALMVGMPVYAWFAGVKSMETMTKIKEPNSLDIRAGHYQPIKNFQLSNINIENMAKDQTAEYRVFSVNAGNYDYKLQLAYTTNIPFKYSIYKATEVASAGENTVSYTPIYKESDDPTVGEGTFYYEIGTEVPLIALNADATNKNHYGRELAKKETENRYYGLTYDNEKGDDPEIYAVPVYLQSKDPIHYDHTGQNKQDFFILKIEYDSDAVQTNGFSRWNTAENNKETDMIYITISRSTN